MSHAQAWGLCTLLAVSSSARAWRARSARSVRNWRTKPALFRLKRRPRGSTLDPSRGTGKGTAMARLDINSLTLWITAAAIQHPTDLATHVAQRTGVTRRTANKALQRLVDLNWLVREGTRQR